MGYENIPDPFDPNKKDGPMEGVGGIETTTIVQASNKTVEDIKSRIRESYDKISRLRSNIDGRNVSQDQRLEYLREYHDAVNDMLKAYDTLKQYQHQQDELSTGKKALNAVLKLIGHEPIFETKPKEPFQHPREKTYQTTRSIVRELQRTAKVEYTRSSKARNRTRQVQTLVDEIASHRELLIESKGDYDRRIAEAEGEEKYKLLDERHQLELDISEMNFLIVDYCEQFGYELDIVDESDARIHQTLESAQKQAQLLQGVRANHEPPMFIPSPALMEYYRTVRDNLEDQINYIEHQQASGESPWETFNSRLGGVSVEHRARTPKGRDEQEYTTLDSLAEQSLKQMRDYQKAQKELNKS